MTRPEWLKNRDIVDAKKGATINIQAEHIERAVACNGRYCVAGECIIQALGAKACWVYRSKTYVVWDDDQPVVRYQNSTALYRDVIRVLDDPDLDNSLIKPGLYDLLKVPPKQRLGLDRSRKPGSVKRKGHGDHGSHRAIFGRVSAAWGYDGDEPVRAQPA